MMTISIVCGILAIISVVFTCTLALLKQSKSHIDAMEEYTDETQKDHKVCKLTNASFSWILEVDGQTISFDGGSGADYFAHLYNSLGYIIVWDRDKWKREQ